MSLLLNASGCLDALTAPDVARALDAFVTKTVTPEPRDGNAPVRIAETDVGMLNSIGLANPGARASRQSSSGPHTSSTNTAAVISAIDEVIRRQCARASRRSDGVITAVTR